MTDEKDAVALLDIHLGPCRSATTPTELADLIEVRDSARKALATTFQIRTSSQLARSHADPLCERPGAAGAADREHGGGAAPQGRQGCNPRSSRRPNRR
jgi:hypothetical protein